MSARILIVSPRFWPEDTQITDICRGLALRGLKVDVLCGQPNFPGGAFFAGYHSFGHRKEVHEGIHIYRTFEIRRGYGTSFGIILNYISTYLPRRLKARALGKNKYDAVLVCQNSPVSACSAGAALARRQNIPVAAYVIDPWPETAFRELDLQNTLLRRIFAGISKKNYRACGAVMAASEETKRYLEGAFGFLRGKISLVRFGPLGAFEKTMPEAGARDKIYDDIRERYAGGFNIVMTENTETGDTDSVLAAAKILKGRGAAAVRIIILCGSFARKKETLGMISKEGLGDLVYVEYAPGANFAARYSPVAGAFLIAEKKGSSNPFRGPCELVNYMSLGIPIVFAAEGEGANTVRKSGCGLVAEPGDPESISRAILSICEKDERERRELGQKGLEYREAHYNTEGCADRILKVLFADDSAEEEKEEPCASGIIKADDLFDDEET